MGKDVTQYNDGGLTKNTTYTYRVYAFNAGGMSITYSNDATATTFDEVPAAASNLAALAVSSSQINLTWEDKATNETGYKVERKTINGSFSAVETISANATSYSDKGLSPNTYYTYRVYPFNAFGNGAYSNEASDTTFPDINNGLVAYYPFNGNANDESGNSNNGTVYGATLTKDRFQNVNKAYSTRSGYIECGNNKIPTNDTISITIWFKNYSDFRLGEVVCLGNSSSTTWGCVINDNHFTLNYGRGCGSTGQLPALIALKDTSWHHVAFVSNGLNKTSKIYYDGNFVASLITANSNGNCNSSNLYIGVDIFSAIELFDGCLDEIRIYNRVLKEEEIRYLATH